MSPAVLEPPGALTHGEQAPSASPRSTEQGERGRARACRGKARARSRIRGARQLGCPYRRDAQSGHRWRGGSQAPGGTTGRPRLLLRGAPRGNRGWSVSASAPYRAEKVDTRGAVKMLRVATLPPASLHHDFCQHLRRGGLTLVERDTHPRRLPARAGRVPDADRVSAGVVAAPPVSDVAPPLGDVAPPVLDVVSPPQATAMPPTTWGHANHRLNDPRCAIPPNKPLGGAQGNSVAATGRSYRRNAPGLLRRTGARWRSFPRSTPCVQVLAGTTSPAFGNPRSSTGAVAGSSGRRPKGQRHTQSVRRPSVRRCNRTDSRTFF
jgi:hypothetical protein